MKKRIFDISLAILLLPILLPIIILFAIILLIIDKQNPFFIQERGITLTRFRFRIIKLRTIREKNKKNEIEETQKNIFINSHYKKNISRFGYWLRRTGLDEIPQIFNVLKGEMSFVGPRPFMVSDLELLKKNDLEYYKLRANFNSKPGITGLWQIFCNRDEGAKNLIALEKIYDDMKSLKYDSKILVYTLPVVLSANNSDAIYSSRNFPFDNSKETEINFVFAKSNPKKQIDDEYSLRINGEGWIDANALSNDSKKDSGLKLIKIKQNVKKAI